jgi:DNA-binding LytR/AlgR family response regulator
MTPPTALIADDEPLLRDALSRQLAQVWPELAVVAAARNGREAIRLFDTHRPAICFLDVQMPGVSGIAVARHIGRSAHIVFVTAFDHYAVEAFAQGVLDYLVKPVELTRLGETVARLKERMLNASPANTADGILEQLAAELDRRRAPTSSPLRWLRAQVGQTLRLIPVDEIAYLRSDSKYTRVAWRGDDGKPCEALVNMTLKELTAQLDPTQFVQVHRSVIVNLRAVDHIVRRENERAEVHLKGFTEVLPVSRNFTEAFRQM